MIGMSATLPNFSVLGTWWRASTYVTGYRPTPLEHRFVVRDLALTLLLQALKPSRLQHGNVMLDSDGLVVRTLEVAPSWKDANDGVMVQLVQETIDQSGSVLVFCASKNDTVTAAKLLAEHLKMPEPPPKSQAPDDLTREEAGERLSMARPVEKQLPHLAACVAKGVAFHNSLLNADEREVVQDCFKFGKIRVICCTSTLAAGVNLPARLVILRQDYGYGNDPGSTAIKQVPLQAAQYQQMAGRAGRTGLDEKGESIILAKPRCDAAHVAKLRKLVLPDPRPLTSALASEAGQSSEYFKLFVLYAVSSGLVVTDLDMRRYVECTLLATLQTAEERQKGGALELRFNKVAQELFGLRLLAKDTTVRSCCALCLPCPASHAAACHAQGTKWLVTDKGKSVVASSLPVAQADILQADIEEARRTGCIFAADHLHSLFLAAPRGFYYPGKWSTVQWPALRNILQGTMHADDVLVLARLGFEGQDITHYQPNSKLDTQRARGVLLQRLHAALVLRALARERPLEEICARFGFDAESDVVRLQEAGSRSLYCAAAMCESRGYAEMQVVFSRMQQRVVAGTQQELVELADVEGMRRGYARVFYTSGIQTLDMLVAQTWEKVAEVLAKVNPNQRAVSRRSAKHQADKLLAAARAAVTERDRRNRQETLALLAAQGLAGEALQQIADKLDAAAEAAAQSGAVSAQSPEASAAALEAAAEREKQLRASLVAAAAVVDPRPPVPLAPPPLPQCSPPDFAFDAAIAEASAQLHALSGAVVLGDDDAVEFEALLRALCSAPLYGFSFATRADGPAPRAITVLGLALALRPGGVAFVSFDGRGGTARRDALAAVLAQPGPAKAALHVKDQIKALAHAAAPQHTPAACLAALGDGAEDPFICAYLLAPDREKDGDKPTTFKLMDMAGVTHATVLAAARFRSGAPTPAAQVQEAALRAAAALAVRGPLRAQLEAAGGLHVPLAEVEMPLVPVLAAMELLGVPFRSGDLDDTLRMARKRLEGACFVGMMWSVRV